MAKSKTNYWKWGIIAAAIILSFWVGCNCGVKSVIKESRIDTIVNTDTVEITVEKEKLVPYQVNKYIKGNPYPVIEWAYDTLFSPVVITDTNEYIVNRFFDTMYYRTVHQLRNGTLMAFDTVTQNRLAGKGFKAIVFDTLIKETTTIFPPQKTVLLFSLSMMGKPTDPFHGAGAGFGLKDKKDRIYSFEIKTIREQGTYGELRLQLPVRNPFKKRK